MSRRRLPDIASRSKTRHPRARTATIILPVVVAVLLATGACEHGPVERAAVTRTTTPLDTAATGTISGRVLFDGNVPPSRSVDIASDPACVAAHPNGLSVSDVLTQDGQVAGAFVYIARGLEDRVFAVPEQEVVVDQRGCLYVPRVVGAQVGQRITFVNSDDTLHNVHGEPHASAPWNFGLGVSGARRTITIDHAEVPVSVRCEVHPWMTAYLGVVEHPYYAVTITGIFGIDAVPSGHYVVAAWHPVLGTQQSEVEVKAHETTEVDLVFPAR